MRLPGTGVTVLADPWLVGPLTFGPPALAWLYSGAKPSGDALGGVALAEGADLLLLTQGLDDHAHRPTLLAMRNKALPVVASPAGAAVARACGFTDVTALRPGEQCTLRGVTFAATQGALVGPPWSTRENGFALWEDDAPRGACVYYEPHCDFVAASVQSALAGRSVDVVITPTTGVSLAGYPLVLAKPAAVLALLRLLRPSVVLPLRNDQVVEAGAIAGAIGEEGSVEAVRAALAGDAQLAGRVRVLEAAPAGTMLAVELP
jgi:L-ascorbate metabolism protein UlaG (beta-lactamase superfamily)